MNTIKIFQPEDLFLLITKDLSWRGMFYKHYTCKEKRYYWRWICIASFFFVAGCISFSFLTRWHILALVILIVIMVLGMFMAKKTIKFKDKTDKKYFEKIGITADNEKISSTILKYKLSRIGDFLGSWNNIDIYEEIIENFERNAKKHKFKFNFQNSVFFATFLIIVSFAVNAIGNNVGTTCQEIGVYCLCLFLLWGFLFYFWYLFKISLLDWINRKSNQYKDAAEIMRVFKLNAKQLGFVK